MTEKWIADLHQDIKNSAGRQQPEPDRQFHKHAEYLSYGLKASEFRQIMRGFRPRFLKLSLQERMGLATQLLQEHIGELGHVGLHILMLGVEDLRPEHFRSWSHVDHFSLGVMQPLLWRYRRETLELLEEWNRSPIRWKRRASVVTFARKAAKSKEFTDEVIHLCENLILDEEDIKDLRRRGVSSTITLYAIRGTRRLIEPGTP